ncbi:MAG TPA: GTPase ObgE [Patescibacteria group bacterium]
MLIDVASVVFSGGHGGPGIVSFGKKEHSGPDGGNGGKGGDLYLRATSDITLLNQFSMKSKFDAYPGNPGGRFRQSGKDGKDLEIVIPRGTTVIDEETNEVLFELTEIDERKLLCKGGLGGRGNYEFRSSRHTTPKISQPGLPGEEKHIKLVLKLIADFGLVGLPNAGKSSLLNELTNANAKVGTYAFTTLSPNLGVYKGKTIADIPGLIEGASENKGLGASFLKHIEKVGVILHCLAGDTKNPLKDYKTIHDEMKKYNIVLIEKPEVIILTKSDLVDKKTLESLKKKFAKKANKVIAVSIHDWDSLESLKKVLFTLSQPR